MIGFVILSITLFSSAIIALIIAFSARNIDFSERILHRRVVRSLIRERAEHIKKRARKEKRVSVSMPRPKTETESVLEEIASSDTLVGEEIPGAIPQAPRPPPPTEYSDIKASEEEIEPTEETIVEGYARDVVLRLPKNMCLNEVFRLEISLLKSEEFEQELQTTEIDVDKDEAAFYSLTLKKLGETITESTVLIQGLQEGPLTIRPVTLGRIVYVAPSTRTVYFDPNAEKIAVDFYITPIRWEKEVKNVLKIEFEQNYKIIKVIDMPMRIYKYKYEAMFGLNISKWHQYALLIYSILGSIAGFISAFQEKVVPWLQTIF